MRLYFPGKGSGFCDVRETDGERDRRRQTAILTHNFFSWPYHAVFSSRPHIALLLLLCRKVLKRRPVVGRCPREATSHSLTLSMTDRITYSRKLRLTQDWLYMGICRYHFTTPPLTNFHPTIWQFPDIDTLVRPVLRNLWFTSWPRVNMQWLSVI